MKTPFTPITHPSDQTVNLNLRRIADAFRSLTAAVASASSGGRLLRTSYLTAGTSLTAMPGATSARSRQWAGGGSGAGGGGGGSAGGCAETLWPVIPASWTYAIGAGQTGGLTTVAGVAGGNTTLSNGTTTVTAFGGPGGLVNAAVGQGAPAAPAVSTNGTVNGSGDAGKPVPVNNLGGQGGSSALGAGGAGTTVAGAGNNGGNAIGPACGGGGGSSLGGNGGNSTAGLIILEEFS